MKKIFLLMLILGCQIVFAQIELEQNLINSINDYRNNTEESLEKKLWTNVNQKLKILITDKKSENYDYKKLIAHCDTIMFSFIKFETENKKFIAYSMKRPNFNSGLNYVCTKTNKGFKIIHKDLISTYQFFSGIESLSNTEFLLFETQYDLAYGCNYGTVFEYKNQKLKIKDAFSNRKKLTVCNFTSTIEVQLYNKDEIIIDTNKPKFNLLIKIEFDRKNKILYYLNATKSAKYLKGKFKINDYDERKMLE